MQRIKIYPVHWIRLILFFLLAFLIISLFSCKVKKEIVKEYINKDSIVYQEKTVTKFDSIYILADSSYIKAYLQCDSLGNVLIRELHETKGKLKTKVTFENNTIEVLVNVDSAIIIRQAIESYIKETNVNNTQVTTTEKKTRTFVWYYYFIAGIIIGFVLKILIGKAFNYFKKFIP